MTIIRSLRNATPYRKGVVSAAYALLLIALLAASPTPANWDSCTAKLPIDTKEKAWCVVWPILTAQSCVSAYGFDFEAVQVADRWILKTSDRDPRPDRGCRTLRLAVCRDTGQILHSPVSGACDIETVTGSADIEYEISDGKIVVLGHELATHEALPDLSSCEGCEVAHTMVVQASPGQRHVLIVSDVHLANFDAWVLDSQSGFAPTRIASERWGRHLIRTQWHGDTRIELAFAGTAYAKSVFFDPARPGEAWEVGGFLAYDPESDSFVSHRYDWETSSHQVEVGKVFGEADAVERFPVALDTEYISDALGMFETVEINGADLIVTYRTAQAGVVREVFQPALLLEAN